MSQSGRTIGALIVLVGALLLIATVFVPWYSESESFHTPVGGSWSYTTTSYPGLANQNGTVRSSCSGAALPLPVNGSLCPPSQTSYNGADLNTTGLLVETGYFLLLAGFVLGVISALIGLATRRRSKGAVTAGALGIVAMVLAVAVPVLFAVLLPTAISDDLPQETGSGPWSSFMGSHTTNLVDISVKLTWGPAIGWYLSFVAFVVLLVGAIVLILARKGPASPAPISVPEPTTNAKSAPVSDAPPAS